MKMKHALVALACTAAASAPAWAQQTQGVSKDQITLGSIQDLSGPLAGFGKQLRMGMQLRVDEVNEQGGVNGRKLNLKFEDSGYDPKRAVLAAQKLVNQDKVFLVASHIGTPQNNAAMPVQFEKGVINWMPLSAGREMFDPPHKLKFASVAFSAARMASGCGDAPGRAITTATPTSPKSGCGTPTTALSATPGISLMQASISAG